MPFQSKFREQTLRLIRQSAPDFENYHFRKYPEETKDLIMKMLIKNPQERITLEEALNHNYFKRNGIYHQG